MNESFDSLSSLWDRLSDKHVMRTDRFRPTLNDLPQLGLDGSKLQYGGIDILSLCSIPQSLTQSLIECRLGLTDCPTPGFILIMGNNYFPTQIIPLIVLNAQAEETFDLSKKDRKIGNNAPLTRSRKRELDKLQSKTRDNSPKRSEAPLANEPAKCSTVQFVLRTNPVGARGVIPQKGLWCFLAKETRAVIPIDVDLTPLATKSTHHLLNTLFKTVDNKRKPTSILFWGHAGSGKTALVSTLINIIHGHSSGSHDIDHGLTGNATPNPITKYPSTLVNLLDSSSVISKDITALMKTSIFLDQRDSSCDAVIFILSLTDCLSNTLPEARLGYDWALQCNMIPIVVLTHIDSTPDFELNKIISGLASQFSNVIPISNYTRDTKVRSIWTECAGSEILLLARKLPD